MKTFPPHNFVHNIIDMDYLLCNSYALGKWSVVVIKLSASIQKHTLFWDKAFPSLNKFTGTSKEQMGSYISRIHLPGQAKASGQELITAILFQIIISYIG
jgi:hypothetical protein